MTKPMAKTSPDCMLCFDLSDQKSQFPTPLLCSLAIFIIFCCLMFTAHLKLNWLWFLPSGFQSLLADLLPLSTTTPHLFCLVIQLSSSQTPQFLLVFEEEMQTVMMKVIILRIQTNENDLTAVLILLKTKTLEKVQFSPLSVL